LRSPSLDSALRASLRLAKIAPGDFVASLHPGYILLGFATLNPTDLYFEMNASINSASLRP
jgi:hypothetical protein